MRSPMPCCFLAPCLILFLGSSMLAADPAKPADRESVLAKLKANKVSLLSLTIESKDGGPAINLGTGENGVEATNATHENLRLIAQHPVRHDPGRLPDVSQRGREPGTTHPLRGLRGRRLHETDRSDEGDEAVLDEQQADHLRRVGASGRIGQDGGSQGAGLGCPLYGDLGPQGREVVGGQRAPNPGEVRRRPRRLQAWQRSCVRMACAEQAHGASLLGGKH